MINEAECAFAGLDEKKVASIARRLSRAARDANALGITIFGGSGSGSLRIHDLGSKAGALILADLDGLNWDGGDGGSGPSDDGLRRGER